MNFCPEQATKRCDNRFPASLLLADCLVSEQLG